MGSRDSGTAWKTLVRVALVLSIVIFCKYVSVNYYQFMLVQGNSMSPTYHNFQLVILDKQDREYRTGDVIAFRCEDLNAILVKRIAACPGQSAVIRDGTLYVDGDVSPFYEDSSFEYAGLLENEQRLSEGEYIVIGDNIAESKDSRYEQVGIIRAESVIGKVATTEISG